MSTSLIQRIQAVWARLFRQPPAAPSTPAPLPPVETSPVSRERIEQLVGMPVCDLALYERALMHRSLLRGRAENALLSNERLEFLGDAALGFVAAEHLYRTFPDKDEGFLTRLRSKIVNGQALARHAREVDLGSLLLISENMEHAGGRETPTILADAFEAVIGAIYLDLGLEQTRTFIHNTMLRDADLAGLADQHDNYKSLLLEYAQARGWPQPEYQVTHEEGPSHDRVFTVSAIVKGDAWGGGTAGSKKKAEQRAAREALRRLREAESEKAMVERG